MPTMSAQLILASKWRRSLLRRQSAALAGPVPVAGAWHAAWLRTLFGDFEMSKDTTPK